MKNRKKLSAVTAFAVVAALVVPTIASADTTSFTDISGSYAAAAIQDLASQGILTGTGNGTFSPKANVTRQDMAIVLAKALKLDVSNPPSTATFSDVPTNNYAFAYVEAAYKAGLIHGQGNGVFGYNQHLTRVDMAIMLVNALGVDATGAASNLNFTDNSKITYGQDQVGYAVKAGLVHGMGDGTFGPAGLATREQVAAIAENFLKLKNQTPQNLAITAATTNVAVGQKDQFSVTGTTDAVTWSVSGNGVIDASGNFVGTAPGTATITATVDGQSVSKAITIYGAAASLKLDTPKSMVANGLSTQNINITVVDANGNPVSNYNGTATVAYDASLQTGSKGAASLYNATTNTYVTTPVTVTITNGVGTLQVESGTLAGVTDNVMVTGVSDVNGNVLDNENGTAYTSSDIAISSVAQVATALKFNVGSTISANNSTTTSTGYVNVVDQDGQPMLNGQYPIALTVSGAGTLNGAVNNSVNLVYNGSNATAGNTNTSAAFTLASKQGVTGAISLSATGTGLTTGTSTVNAIIAGSPVGVKLTNSKLTFNADENTPQTTASDIGLSIVDASGNVVPTSDANVLVTVEDSSSNLTNNVGIGYLDPAGVYHTVTATSTGTFLVPSNATDILPYQNAAQGAGKYTISVTNTTGATYAIPTQTVTVTETAGTFAKAAFATPSAAKTVQTANPNTNFVYQLEDAEGNAVSLAGVKVDAYANNTAHGTAGATVPTATLNGASTSATSQVVGTTDANGQVKFTLAPQQYDGSAWDVVATAPVQPNVSSTVSAASAATSEVVTLNSVVASQLGLTLTNASAAGQTYSGSNQYAVAGQTVNLVVTAEDQYGNALPTNTDTVTITVPAGFAVPTQAGVSLVSGTTNQYTVNLVGGAKTVQLTAATAGLAQVSVVDNTTASNAATVNMNVQAGQAVGAAVFANGTMVTSTSELAVSANTPVAVNIEPVDSMGNPVVDTAAKTYTLTDNGAAGSFEATSGGTQISTVTLAAGQSSATVYYTNTTAGSVNLTASVAPSTAALSGTVTTVGANTLTATAFYQGQPLNGTYTVAVNGLTTPAGGTAPTVPATATFVNGTASIPVTVTNAAAQTVTVAVTVNGTTFTTGALNIAPAAGAEATAAVTYTTGTVSEATPGSTSAAAVSYKDSYGNTVAVPAGGTFALTAPTGANADGLVTINSATGVVSVASGASASDIGTYTVTYTNGSVTQTATVSVTA